ncbi:MAG TPA: FkbM family methyltransferase [Verrucomicrobiae bacterium]|jgi:FkbM family methyltransferase
MALFSRLLVPGDTVVEIGGHIGYISLFFKHLVQNGEVWVFEPGENNLPYVRKNVSKKGINLVEKAAGDRNGKEVFFLESLTGQNNSFVRGFKGLENNATNAFVGQPKITEATVEMVRGDDFINTHSITPSLIKIDVEGFELSVLNGMAGTIARCRPKLMVEVQADQEKIYQMLVGGGYVLFDARLSIRLKPRDLRGNIFALHSENHRMLLNQLGVDSQKQPVANS